MKHTPGKWTKERNLILDSTGDPIAVVDYRQSGYVQTNALLISLAPEMYEALNDLVRLIDVGISADALRIGGTMVSARAILSKLEA
jgi:hypothetical protein